MGKTSGARGKATRADKVGRPGSVRRIWIHSGPQRARACVSDPVCFYGLCRQRAAQQSRNLACVRQLPSRPQRSRATVPKTSCAVCYNVADMREPKKRAPTSGTRKGSGPGLGGPAKGTGLWGPANGMGWGGDSRASAQTRSRPMTAAERARLRREMIELYLSIARDAAQPALLRMQAARHLLERVDDPFSDMLR